MSKVMNSRLLSILALVVVGGPALLLAGCVGEPESNEIQNLSEDAAVASAKIVIRAMQSTGQSAQLFWKCQFSVPGGEGCIRSDGKKAAACDTSADGLGVTTWYGGTNGGGNVGDGDGAAGGPFGNCGEEGPDRGGTITHWHYCVGSRCSPESPL
jgi:hypothetical protein